VKLLRLGVPQRPLCPGGWRILWLPRRWRWCSVLACQCPDLRTQIEASWGRGRDRLFRGPCIGWRDVLGGKSTRLAHTSARWSQLTFLQVNLCSSDKTLCLRGILRPIIPTLA
jgi:hypothetical protein